MRKLKTFSILFLIFSFLLCGLGWSEEAGYDDHSIRVEIGSGNGAVLIIGDGNSVFLPPVEEECIEPEAFCFADGSCALVLSDLTIHGLGVFKRVIIVFGADGSVSIPYIGG